MSMPLWRLLEKRRVTLPCAGQRHCFTGAPVYSGPTVLVGADDGCVTVVDFVLGAAGLGVATGAVGTGLGTGVAALFGAVLGALAGVLRDEVLGGEPCSLSRCPGYIV